MIISEDQKSITMPLGLLCKSKPIGKPTVCHGCSFNKSKTVNCYEIPCRSFDRADGDTVIFIEVTCE
jgi:hypothetical protein